MSAKSGATKNRETLQAITGLTDTQATKLSGADLMQYALATQGGVTYPTLLPNKDGARLTLIAGRINL